MLQAELFDVYLLLTHYLNRVALLGTELCCYAILQLVQFVSQKGSQIKAKSLNPTYPGSVILVLYC